MGTIAARGMTAALLALAGSAAVGIGSVQGYPGGDLFEDAPSVQAVRGGLSAWDSARLQACVGWLKLARRDLHSDLDRRSACGERLGLEAAATH